MIDREHCPVCGQQRPMPYKSKKKNDEVAKASFQHHLWSRHAVARAGGEVGCREVD